jgi:hypothetical protein
MSRRKNYKDFLYYEGMKGIKVMDPCMDKRGMEDGEIWGEDPIHPKQLGNSKIASGVIKMINNMADMEHKRRRTDSLESSGSGGNDARRGRRDAGSGGEWTPNYTGVRDQPGRGFYGSGRADRRGSAGRSGSFHGVSAGGHGGRGRGASHYNY